MIKNHFSPKMIQSLLRALEKKDKYLVGHSRRVAEIAVKIGSIMVLSEQEMKALTLGALLHDIGKIGISDSILHKPGKLTEAEMREITLHPLYGYEIMKPMINSSHVLSIIRSHHERYDGAGYPDKLKGEHIPLLARIVSLADAFDAMTSERPYQRALSEEMAMGVIIRESGKQFDPKVVSAFLTVQTEKPWCTDKPGI